MSGDLSTRPDGDIEVVDGVIVHRGGLTTAQLRGAVVVAAGAVAACAVTVAAVARARSRRELSA